MYFILLQQNLQSTLVTLGEVDHAMDDIIEFLTKTEEELQDLDHVYGDPKYIEAHLRKLQMMQKDLKNREPTVDKLNKAVSMIFQLPILMIVYSTQFCEITCKLCFCIKRNYHYCLGPSIL